MNDDSSKTLRFSSLPPHGRFLKRRKLDESNLSTSSNDSILGIHWELERAKRELTTLRTKLSQTEATVIEHHKLRKQTEGLFEKENNILRAQVRVDREMIQQLQEDLRTSIRSFHEAREAQAAAETELSQIRTSMEQRVAELVEANWKSQQELKRQSLELEESKMIIEKLNSGKRTSANRKVVFNNSQKRSDVLQRKSQKEEERAAVVRGKSTKRPSILFNKSGYFNRIFLAKCLNNKAPPTDTNDSRASSSRNSDKENLSPSAASVGHKVGPSSYSSSLTQVEDVNDDSSSAESLLQSPSDSSSAY